MNEELHKLFNNLLGNNTESYIIYLQTPYDKLGTLQDRIVLLGNNESYVFLKDNKNKLLEDIVMMLDEKHIDYKLIHLGIT